MHIVTGNESTVLTGHDRMAVFILAKLRIIESSLGSLLAQSGNHESVREFVLKIHEIHKQRSTEMTNEEAGIALLAYQETYHAIFGEDLPAK